MFIEQVNKRTLSDCHLLIVDDQASSRVILEGLLGDMVSCTSVSSGGAALAYCDENTPDLILMDVNMPGMNGHQVAKTLLENPSKSDIPIIFVTATTSDEAQSKCWDSGCVDFVTKPFNACTLRNRVKAHLNHKLKKDLLENLIYIDRLTGAYNRHYLEDYLPRFMKDGKRSHNSLSLVLFDVDYFKRYNDRYGHMEGDSCLWKLSKAVKDSLLRPMDKLVRVGGEEFLVILPCTDEEGAKLVADRILATVFNLDIAHADSNHARVTISAGIATKKPDDSKTIDFTMLRADKNLYAAKGQGRNCVVSSVETAHYVME
ncbi:Diguanylate cyclase [Alteromonas sp. 38]|uniref:GGDEF domain-containing response regulator n=1 Tax=unclassified Alteromonas TaxID=2614992 RepID=UPI0012F20526|nr:MULTISPECIES: diguanylate cyclase [unclassified Alteromonas]CAD5258690.1 Diguanylate cyclase [Alteromonas sp. 154]VXC36571.1 Diguanylate cyclase [Alteromonas sp. 38]